MRWRDDKKQGKKILIKRDSVGEKYWRGREKTRNVDGQTDKWKEVKYESGD